MPKVLGRGRILKILTFLILSPGETCTYYWLTPYKISYLRGNISLHKLLSILCFFYGFYGLILPQYFVYFLPLLLLVIAFMRSKVCFRVTELYPQKLLRILRLRLLFLHLHTYCFITSRTPSHLHDSAPEPYLILIPCLEVTDYVPTEAFKLILVIRLLLMPLFSSVPTFVPLFSFLINPVLCFLFPFIKVINQWPLKFSRFR